MTVEDCVIHELARLAQRKAIRRRKRGRPVTSTHCGATAQAAALSPTQARGRVAERQARQYLQNAGLRIIAQNLRCKAGEIDLVGLDGPALVFIEVRRRRSARYGGAAASVNRSKQLRLIRAANYFLPELGRRYFAGAMPVCRFDVVTLEPSGLHWLKHAFADAG